MGLKGLTEDKFDDWAKQKIAEHAGHGYLAYCWDAIEIRGEIKLYYALFKICGDGNRNGTLITYLRPKPPEETQQKKDI
ncbi:MAG: hypothetical protein WC413_03545 [Candidatus Nanoarchaeia archaeon]